MPANPLELLAPHLRYLLGAAHEAAGSPISAIGHTLTQAAPSETLAGLGHAPIHLAAGSPPPTPDLLTQLQPFSRPPATRTGAPPSGLPSDLAEAGLRRASLRGSQLGPLDLYERMQAAHAGAHTQLQAGTIHPDVAFSQLIQPRSTPLVRVGNRDVPNPFLSDPASASALEPQLRSMVDEALLRGDKLAASDAAQTYLSLYTSGRLEELSRASATPDAPDFAAGSHPGLGRYDESKLGADLLKTHPDQDWDASPQPVLDRPTGRDTRHGLLPTDSGDHAATLARLQSAVDLGGPAGDRAKVSLDKYLSTRAPEYFQAQRYEIRPGNPPQRPSGVESSTGGTLQTTYNSQDLAVSHPIDGALRAWAPGGGKPASITHTTATKTKHWLHIPEAGDYAIPYDMDLPPRYRITPQVRRPFDTQTAQPVAIETATAIIRRLGKEAMVAPNLGSLVLQNGKVDSVALYRDLRRAGVSQADFIKAVLGTKKFDGVSVRAIGHGPKGSTIEKTALWASRRHATLANTRWANQ